MSMTHPFDTDTTYELLEDGNVRVSCGDKAGIFTGEGIHVSGDIRFADPQVCTQPRYTAIGLPNRGKR
jgi:hypothetical protein